ncbi:MAG: sporulation protein [Methylomonas sp.]|nr:MAG: sporulation protein [Methylomonas sp.]
MDQELKQRLIGAAVITALAAIFVPMLFDDPIDESGKSINELKIPELPAKAQDVEIMPLPEKVEDVATIAPIEKPPVPAADVKNAFEGEDEADMEAPKPLARITAKETAAPPAKFIEPDAEEEDVAIHPMPVEPAKPVKPTAKVAATEVPAKSPKPVVAEPVIKQQAPAVATAETPSATRLYLNAGSFSQLANAQTLQETLKKQGYAASIKEVVTEKGKVFKVRVGPMLDKAKAQAVKSKLSQININSFVTGDE